jgi:hypothetical protein
MVVRNDDIDEFLDEVKEAVIRIAADRIDPIVGEQIALDCLDTASYYNESDLPSTRISAARLARIGADLARALKVQQRQQLANLRARNRIGSPALFRYKLKQLTGPEHEPTFEEILAQQPPAWISSSAKREQERDAQKRLDDISRQQHETQEREIAALRQREQRAAERAAAEAPAWRKRFRRRDPLRG